MIESNLKKYFQLETLNVSRETFPALEEFRSLLLSENKKINLISKSTEKDSIKRHIIDSAQIIDIIEFTFFSISPDIYFNDIEQNLHSQY